MVDDGHDDEERFLMSLANLRATLGVLGNRFSPLMVLPQNAVPCLHALDLRGLGGLVVIHSAASAKGPVFNSLVARAYLRFNS